MAARPRPIRTVIGKPRPPTGARKRATPDGRGHRSAIQAGVRVGVGTDYVGFPPEYAVRELAQLVQAGMTPMQAIQAATRVNAELLGWEDRLGTVEPGKLADLMAVEGDPLEDISALERVRFVLVGGRVARQD